MRNALLVLVVMVLIGAGAYAALTLARPQVTVTEVVEGPVVHAFYATGTVLPRREFPVKSNLAGIVTEVRVDKGDRVEKDQVVAFVSAPEMVFKLRQAEAELSEKRRLADESTSPVLGEFDTKLAAVNQIMELAKRERDRLAGLLANRATSPTDVDRAEERVRTAWMEAESIKAQKAARRISLQREVEVAEAALEIARWNADQQQLKAPIAGTVLDRPVSVGTRLAINDHVMQTADVSAENLVMRANVDEEDVGQVRPGQVVRMTLYSFAGEIFEGAVDRIYDKADPDRRTFEVDVKFAALDKRLAAGMTGELAFVMAEKDKAAVAPAQAWQDGALWTVKDGVLSRRQAKIGLRSVERIEVAEGVQVGESVVITPVAGLDDGQAVRTRRMDPAEAAGLNKPAVQEPAFKGFN